MLVQFFLWLSFFISLSLIFLDSVLLIGAFSLLFSLCICFLVSAFFSSWFSIIAVIVYVGGLLVMFSYFLAVCPNQVMNSKWEVLLISGAMALMAMIFSSIFFFGSGSGLTELEFLYKMDDGLLLVFLIILLLFTLLSVVSIVSLSQGPLRPFFRG